MVSVPELSRPYPHDYFLYDALYYQSRKSGACSRGKSVRRIISICLVIKYYRRWGGKKGEWLQGKKQVEETYMLFYTGMSMLMRG